MNSILEKFGLSERDNDFNLNEGWVEYYLTKNVPDTVKNPFKPDEQNWDNLTSIRINLFVEKIDANYCGSTMVPYGNTYVEYEPAGWEIDNVDYDTSIEYKFDDMEIIREHFRDINELSEDDLKNIEYVLTKEAQDSYQEYIEENYEPPESDPPEPPDKYDYY